MPGGCEHAGHAREEPRVRLSPRQQRTLHAIELDPAASEPGLHAFFLSFNTVPRQPDA